MVTYYSEALYIESKTGLKAKIVAIDALITAMFAAAAKAATTGHLEEYSLDTGQTKIKTAYRNPESLMAGIKVYETQKNTYINQLNGRGMRLIDGKNFRG